MKKHKIVNVGFTYDLKHDYINQGFTPEEVAEFDTQETIDAICHALEQAGFSTDRIGNVKSLITRLTRGDRWDMVFNICEGVHGIGREAQVPAMLDVYNIPYVFSDVMVLSLTLHKGYTKHIIRDHGIPTAPFFIAQNVKDIKAHSLTYPLFIKPVAEGTGKGIDANSRVNNLQELIEYGTDKLNRYNQPLLVEEFLPGREFTVGMVGTGADARVIGMMEVNYRANETPGIYSYQNKAHYEDYIDYSVPEKEVRDACGRIALDSWRALNCRDGGRIDLRMDNRGIPNFIEVNPLAGLNPIHSDLPILAAKAGVSYQQLIEMIMDSALKRTGLAS